MRVPTYIEKHPPCARVVVDHYSLQSGGRPPEDFVRFCLSDNGGALEPHLCDYRVPQHYPNEAFTAEGMTGVQRLCGMGPMENADIYSVEGQEETLRFLGLPPSEHWVIALGDCYDGYLMGVADHNRGQVFYCYFDSGDMYLVAESFTEFINGLGSGR